VVLPLLKTGDAIPRVEDNVALVTPKISSKTTLPPAIPPFFAKFAHQILILRERGICSQQCNPAFCILYLRFLGIGILIKEIAGFDF
jgi:hypothetical protein